MKLSKNNSINVITIIVTYLLLATSTYAVTIKEFPENMELPKIITIVAPSADNANIGDSAVIGLTINKYGSVKNIKVLNTSNPRFAESVTDVVKLWQFEPFLEKDASYELKVAIPFRVGYEQHANMPYLNGTIN
jgi:TonB family protein